MYLLARQTLEAHTPYRVRKFAPSAHPIYVEMVLTRMAHVTSTCQLGSDAVVPRPRSMLPAQSRALVPPCLLESTRRGDTGFVCECQIYTRHGRSDWKAVDVALPRGATTHILMHRAIHCSLHHSHQLVIQSLVILKSAYIKGVAGIC
jgi:hypothetical protein